WLAFVAASSWLVLAYASRFSSLASVVVAVLAPMYYLMGAKVLWPLHPPIAIAIVVIAVVLLFRHQQNIARLLQGKESRIGEKGQPRAPVARPHRKSRR